MNVASSAEARETSLDFDDFAWKLASHLLEDFKPFLEESYYDAMAAITSSRNVVALRQKVDGSKEHLTPYQMKLQRQIDDLFKKFTFSKDLFS
jgi:hypothetical protein